MASYSKKKAKSDPSFKRNKSDAPDTQLTFPLSRAGTGNINILQVDGPRLLSTTQHRLYRQCGTYRMKIDLHTSAAEVAGFRVVTLANTWYVKRSIQTARDMFDRAMADELSVSTKSRWYDFRIGVGPLISGVSDDMLAVLGSLPTNMNDVAFQGEWFESNIVDAAGNTRGFDLTGTTGISRYNIFEEYDNMANGDASPQSAPPGGYDGVDATITSANVVELANQGNVPPYNQNDLLDQVFVSQGQLYRSGGLSRESTGFFDAPLGLVWIVPDSATSPNPPVMLEFASGKYKGVRMEAY